MTRREGAHLLADGVEIVKIARRRFRYRVAQDLRILSSLLRPQRRCDELTHVETVEREMNGRIDLVAEGTFKLEAFEVDDEDGREAGEGELFGSFARHFAARTIPVRSRLLKRSSWEGGDAPCVVFV